MKIVCTPVKSQIITFTSLCVGDVFKFEERYYIKINNEEEDFNCIELYLQSSKIIKLTTPVILIPQDRLTITIEE